MTRPIAHQQGTTNLNTYSYIYDPLSRLQSITSTAEGLTTYAYDPRSQLTAVDNANVPDESFAYDAGGNRSSAGYTIIADNRATASPGMTYQYDHEGNITQSSDGSGVWLYTWDHRNRLVKAQRNSHTIEYEYDAFNRLYSRKDSSFGAGTTYWVYDEGINPVLQFDNVSGPRQLYLWSDAIDDLLAAEEIPSTPGSSNILWPLSDHLGTIRDIADRSDSTGVTTVVNHRRYSAFGERLSETNAAVDLIFGYTGKLFDEATGLQNNLNRWYDPNLGKEISQDPIGFAGGDANLYRYVENQPTDRIDPSGLDWIPKWLWDWMNRPVKPLNATGGDVSKARQSVFAPSLSFEPGDPLRRAGAQDRDVRAKRSANMVEMAGEFTGQSSAMRLMTQEHLSGEICTNGELLVDGMSLAAGSLLATMADAIALPNELAELIRGESDLRKQQRVPTLVPERPRLMNW